MKRFWLVLALSTLITGSLYAAQASLPNAIAPGDLADGSKLDANFDEIYSKYNDHDTATTGIHGLGTGVVVGTTNSQTLTNKTIGAATVSGDATFSTGIKAIFGNAARYIKDNTSVYAIEFGTHTVIPATSKLYLDGGSDTYITSDSANQISLVCNGTNVLAQDASFTYLGFGSASNVDTGLKICQDGNVIWEISQDDSESNRLTFRSGTTVRYVFNSNGSAAADVEWTTFSPNIKKDTGKQNPTADDYLDWALTDSKKPVKPYEGIPEDKAERAKYEKSPAKIAIGTANWAEGARIKIKALETKVADLEKRIEKLEAK
jgi:hypothetical protein